MSKVGASLFGAGALGFLVLSFLSWYVSIYQDENAWDGETSLAAAIGMVGGVGFLIGGLCVSSRKSKMILSILALLGSLVCFICTLVYIGENAEDIYVRGRIIPSGLQQTAYIALVPGALAVAGGIVYLIDVIRSRR